MPESKPVAQRLSTPIQDSAYMPPPESSARAITLNTAMAPWIRNRCLLLIQYILHLPDAEVFSVPVDSNKFPTYSEEVEDPMDLGTVRKYLLAGKDSSRETDYQSVGDFVYDVRLVWSNCALFNSPDSAIHERCRDTVFTL